jgi:hypothetical protein
MRGHSLSGLGPPAMRRCLAEIVSVAAFARIRATFQTELSFHKETLICTVNSFVACMNTDLMDSAASSGLRELGDCQQ